MTSSRTTYAAGTPDRPTFFRAPEDDPTGIRGIPITGTNGSAVHLAPPGVMERVGTAWRNIPKKSREVVKNNTGMLLIAASQVCETCFICSVDIV